MFAIVTLLLCQGDAPAAASRPASVLEQIDKEYCAIGEQLRKSYVSVSVERGDQQKVVFSGTLVDGEGKVAVPSAGLVGAVKIYAGLEGKVYRAEKWNEDPSSPIAILELVYNDRDPAPRIAPTGSLRVGETVALVSNANDFDATTLFGTVSGLNRTVALFPAMRLIQTTINAVPGTFGGVVGNRRGEVLGVLLGGPELHSFRVVQFGVAGTDEGRGGAGAGIVPFVGAPAVGAAPQQVGSPGALAGNQSQQQPQSQMLIESRIVREPGISLVLPIEQITMLIHNFKLVKRQGNNSARRGELPYLGVVLRDNLDDLTRAQLGLDPGVGLMVDEVVEASPAKAAGLTRFDVVVRFEGELLRGTEHFKLLFQAAAPRGTAKLNVLRQSKPVELDLTFQKQQ